MRNYKGPLFQHRHYAAIAKVLSEAHTHAGVESALLVMFQRDNPNFDATRFLAAAKGEPIKNKDRR
jgi:hypothetical protein